ncbi:HemK2/MTQ2 family protein methyltransferase [Actinocorallia sp. B10E7]|uniref:HemK2/MTQ2 family protein methyltransferase n=1 Tax=Actinocorallia sp. B10E7 TaxID=3153558 RepID=UPI00325DF8F2
MLRLPGVYRPQGDTHLLCDALKEAGVRGAKVLDVCTGTGRVALAAALYGAAKVTAVDVSWRAVVSARANALMRGLDIRVRQGDLFTPVKEERFDVITVNPPYVPNLNGEPGRHGRERAWDAGPGGRATLDRVCDQAPRLLGSGGMLLMVHSALCGVETTLGALRASGLKASVLLRREEPFGPVMRGKADELASHGLIRRGQDREELVVISAERA